MDLIDYVFCGLVILCLIAFYFAMNTIQKELNEEIKDVEHYNLEDYDDPYSLDP